MFNIDIECFSDDCSTKKSLMIEYAYDVAMMRIEQEYKYESGLVELYNNKSLYLESAENIVTNNSAKRHNIFIRVIKGIHRTISNFISDIIDLITNIFSKSTHITTDDYLSSDTGKIQLDCDMRELQNIIDDEIRKGDKLLQAVSSATGISDKDIDFWIQKGAKRLDKSMPTLIPMMMTKGFRAIFTSKLKDFKSKADSVKNEIIGDSNNTDSKKEHQKKRIYSHMSYLINKYGMAAKDATMKICKNKGDKSK